MKVNGDEEEGSCGLGKWLRLAGKRDREHLKKLKTSGMEDGKRGSGFFLFPLD